VFYHEVHAAIHITFLLRDSFLSFSYAVAAILGRHKFKEGLFMEGGIHITGSCSNFDRGTIKMVF
jgi:hypothetical protein